MSSAQPVPGGLTPFSVALVERLLLLSPKPGDRVIDPFAGTGTVGVVAKILGRQCTLIELNPKFAADAQKRIAETTA
jgi:DNA modification methylase